METVLYIWWVLRVHCCNALSELCVCPVCGSVLLSASLRCGGAGPPAARPPADATPPVCLVLAVTGRGRETASFWKVSSGRSCLEVLSVTWGGPPDGWRWR